jgi:Mg-chelatase subunit ChlD
VHALRGDGTALPGWPQTVTGVMGSAAAVGDLDGDGAMEVVLAVEEDSIYAWHADGAPVAGWPQPASQRRFFPDSTAALADLDDDGLPEVLAMSSDGTMLAWQADGTPLPASPLGGLAGYYDQPAVYAPIVGDVDGQGPAVVGIHSASQLPSGKIVPQVLAVRPDGTLVPGWPLTLPTFTGSGTVLADLDEDGHVELVAVSDGLYVWNLPGAGPDSAAEWPLQRHDLRRTGTLATAAGVALLFDTSGSMSWRHDGTTNVPVEEQRITKAKEAAYPFLQLLQDFASKRASFGIATFPLQPAVECEGDVKSPMTLVSAASIQPAISTTVPGLAAAGSTPLLAGMHTARGLFGGERNRAIVLLSDGYHNCPSAVDPDDAEVTSLIGQLQAESARVFAIGFGKPTDIDHPLLEALAEETTPPGYLGSQFYDVTGPTFDPANWDPATALHDTYKSILVDALGLQAAADPLGTLAAGQTAARLVHVSAFDRRVSFFVSWVKSDPHRLALEVRASDGSLVDASDPGVSVHHGGTYAIVTVGRFFLTQPGKVGLDPWRLTLSATRLRPGEKEKYQYSVIVDSALRLDGRIGPRAAFAGQPLRITARLRAAGHPITGLSNVWVKVTRPTDSLGNWLTVNQVTPAQIGRIPRRVGAEPIPPRQRRAQAIASVLGVAPPGYTPAQTLQLFDDGSHGDVRAADGVYTNHWPATPHPGAYRFVFSAEGRGERGAFDRELVRGRQVGLLVSTTASPRTLGHTGPGPARLTVIPKDDLGNFLGPGRARSFRIVPALGRMAGPLNDLGNGSYAQILVPPSGVNAENVAITLETIAPRQ